MKHKTVSVLAVLLICTLLLSGCGGIFSGRVTPTPDPTPEPTVAPTPAPAPTPEPTPTPAPVYDLNFSVGGTPLSASAESLNLTQAAPDEIDRLITVLPALSALKTLELGTADAAAPTVSWEQIRAIQTELGENDEAEEEGIRKRMEGLPLNEEARSKCEKEIDRMSRIAPGSPEYRSCRSDG